MWQKKYNISKQEVYNYQKSAMEASGGYIEDKYFWFDVSGTENVRAGT